MTLDKNLVAYWRLEDTQDVSGNGYSLTNNGSTTFASAKINNGADFGTSNSTKYLSINSNLGITTTGSKTISSWVKLNTEIASGIYTIHRLGKDNGIGDGYFFTTKYEYNGGTRRIKVDFYDRYDNTFTITYNITLGTSNWYNIVTIFNGSQIELFVNGVSQGTQAVTQTYKDAGGYGNWFSVGANKNTASLGDYASLLQDEVAVWSRALTTTEVSALYNSGSGYDFTDLTTGLKAYYKLNESSGNAYDAIGSYPLTNSNTVGYTTGKIDNCADFGSTDSHNKTLNRSDGLGVDLSKAMSFSLWINLNASVGGTRRIVQWESTTGTSRTVLLTYDGTNLALGYGGGGTDISVAQTLTVGTWYHITATCSATGVTTLYVNGVSVGTGVIGTNTGGNFLYIGAANSSIIGIPAKIDELGFWSRTLTSAEVSDLYNSGSGYDPVTLTVKLRSYWALNESSGNAEDGVGENDATNNSVTYSSGKLGNGAVFDGSTSYLSHAASLFPTGSGVRSWSGWVKLDVLPSSGNAVVIAYYGANSAGNGCGLAIYNNAGTYKLRNIFYGTDYDETITISTGVWYHVASTYDGVTLKSYFNGSLLGSGASKTFVTTATGGNIGQLNGGSSKIDGMIDELGVWERPLTSGEIATLYNSGSGLSPFSTPVTVSPTAQTVTSSVPARTIGTGVTNAVSAQSATFTQASIYQQGRCYNLDGSNDYVTTYSYGGTGAGSISCYFSTTNTTQTTKIIIGGRTVANSDEFMFLINGSSQFELRLSGRSIVSSVSLVSGTIYELYAEWDDSNVSFYIGQNGASRVLISTQTRVNALTAVNQYIGALNNSGSAALFTQGKIWGVMIGSSLYKCDEQSGTTSYDSSGNDRHGTIINATLSTFHSTQSFYSYQNEVGYSKRMYFDGVNDHVQTPAFSLSANQPFKVEVDVTFDKNIIALSRVFGTPTFLNFTLYWSTTTQLRLTLGGSALSPTSALTMDNKSHRVVVEHTGSNISITVDGVSVFSQANTYSGVTSELLYIGSNGSSQYTNGTIYNLSITKSSILERSYLGYGNTNANWVDTSGNGKNGTVSGSPSEIFIPRNESNITNDIFGNELDFKGGGMPYTVLVGTGVTKSVNTQNLLFRGSKMDFDGSNDYVRGHSSLNMNLSGNTLRIKGSFIYETNNRVIVAQGATSGGWMLYVDVNNLLHFQTKQGGGVINYRDMTCDTTLSPNTMYDFDVTVTTSSMTATINGISQTVTVGSASGTYSDQTVVVSIGARGGGASLFWDGTIWSIELYKNSVLQAKYEGSGNTNNDWIDLSGNAYNATVNGSPEKRDYIASNVVAGTGATQSPSAQVATFSIPAYTASVPNVTVTPSAQVATLSIPAYTASVQRYINVGTTQQSLTFSIPAYLPMINILASASVKTLTFSIPQYIVSYDRTISANSQNLTFSVPAYDVYNVTNVSPLSQAVEFSIPAYSVLYDKTVFPETQVATLSIPSLYKYGAVWVKTPRATSSTWSRTSRNSD